MTHTLPIPQVHSLLLAGQLAFLALPAAAQTDEEKAGFLVAEAETARDGGDFARCVTFLERAEELLGRPELRVQGLLIECLYKGGDLAGTVREAEEYLTLRPDQTSEEYRTIGRWLQQAEDQLAAQRTAEDEEARLEAERRQGFAEADRRADQEERARLEEQQRREEELRRASREERRDRRAREREVDDATEEIALLEDDIARLSQGAQEARSDMIVEFALAAAELVAACGFTVIAVGSAVLLLGAVAGQGPVPLFGLSGGGGATELVLVVAPVLGLLVGGLLAPLFFFFAWDDLDDGLTQSASAADLERRVGDLRRDLELARKDLELARDAE